MTVSTTRTQRVLLAFAWCLGALGCADADSGETLASAQAAIVGGSESEPGTWPAVVSLGGCSGTLVHPRLVLYAAHCGTAIPHVRFGVDALRPERIIDTDFCRAYPNATLGDGTDLAYCVLAEEVRDVEPARVLAGCEGQQLEPGREVTLVGFGVDTDSAEYGTQRSARAALVEVADELVVAAPGVDTCKGDSGGPVLLPLAGDAGDAGDAASLRLVGVTSSGTSRHCGEGAARYVNVARKLAWLEQSSDLDVSPCFADGRWSPTPQCGQSTCGEPWRDPSDTEPPTLGITLPESPLHRALEASQSYFETRLDVAAEDATSGVKSLTFTLHDARGALLLERVDEHAPYGLETLRFPLGAYELRARAEDFSGLTTEARLDVRIDPPSDEPGRGCALSVGSDRGGGGSLALLALLSALGRCRCRRASSRPAFRSGSRSRRA